MNSIILIFIIYLIINIYVLTRLNKSYYMDEKMRRLHKILIWFLPFIGPLIFRNFWRKEKLNKLPTNTKSNREKHNLSGDFYESGKGMDF